MFGAEQGLWAYDGISSEQIAAWNPDWIVTGSDPGGVDELKRRLLADPGVATTKAARSGHILILPRKVFLSMSHNVIELIESLADALYTEEA